MMATRSLVLPLVFLCLMACGGGGGGGNNTPPPPPPPTNAAPTFGTLAFSGTEEVDVTGTVSATDPDGDALTFTKTGEPAHGQITQFQTTGAFTYRPATNFAGTDTFAVRVSDTANHQTNGTVTITLANVNDAPTIRDGVFTVSAANPMVDVLVNDPDPDGDALTLTVEATPAPLFNVGATVVNGRVQLSLPPNFAGFTRFNYRAVDGAGLGGVATA
jgi:large repetitive protein